MIKEEVTVLVDKKVGEGKSPKQAYKEINNLKDSQKLFKKLNTRIRVLEKENAKLKKKKVVKQKTAFLQGLGQEPTDKKQKFVTTFANTAHLKRILNALGNDEIMNMTKLSKECIMTTMQTKSGLRFLLKHNLIKTKAGQYFK